MTSYENAALLEIVRNLRAEAKRMQEFADKQPGDLGNNYRMGQADAHNFAADYVFETIKKFEVKEEK